jgi:hypothetical protein
VPVAVTVEVLVVVLVAVRVLVEVLVSVAVVVDVSVVRLGDRDRVGRVVVGLPAVGRTIEGLGSEGNDGAAEIADEAAELRPPDPHAEAIKKAAGTA